MVPVAPPSRRPPLRQGERSPCGPTHQQASVQPPRWRRYKWQPPIGGGTPEVKEKSSKCQKLFLVPGRFFRHTRIRTALQASRDRLTANLPGAFLDAPRPWEE
ncbi:MAG TPA: hypothetical protein VH599_11755 [Ktedonobacterales bacterium]